MKDILKRFIMKGLFLRSLRILICNIDTEQSEDIFEILILLVKNTNKLKVLFLKDDYYPHFFRYHNNIIKLPSAICNNEFWKVFEELIILSLIGFIFSKILPETLFTTSTLMRLDLDGSIEIKVIQKAFKNLKNLTNMRILNNKTLKKISKE